MSIKLLNSSSKDTGSLLKQYELYLGSAEKTSDRRQVANSFMWTIHAAFISGFGLTFAGNQTSFKPFQMLICLQALFLCIFWRWLISSYKKLNSAKFKVIHEIEKKLPANLYAYEWEMLGEGHNRSKYYPFSHIEIHIPLIFLLFWLAAFVFLIKDDISSYFFPIICS